MALALDPAQLPVRHAPDQSEEDAECLRRPQGIELDELERVSPQLVQARALRFDALIEIEDLEAVGIGLGLVQIVHHRQVVLVLGLAAEMQPNDIGAVGLSVRSSHPSSSRRA